MDKIVLKHGFEIFHKNVAGCSVGIGDILFGLLHIQEGLFPSPLHIPLSSFHPKTGLFPNPLNALEFRTQMINDILSNHKTLTKKDLIFVNSDNKSNLLFSYGSLKTLHLNINHSFWDGVPTCTELDTNKEYLIFHTKLRLTQGFDYNIVKSLIAEFCKNFKTNYKIIILGERNFPHTYESEIHGITTIYKELLTLKNNNDIVDLTVDEIYNNLDYYKFKKDLFLIKNAKYNICIGQGGQLCSSLIFGHAIYCTVISPPGFQEFAHQNNGHKYFGELRTLFAFLANL